MVEVIPGILAATADELYAGIQRLEPHVGRVHIDIIDGAFAPNTTVSGWQELAPFNTQTQVQFDIHLMVQNPLAVLAHWWQVARAKRFFVHVEAGDDALTALTLIRANRREAGLAVNPETDTTIVSRIATSADAVLMMGVHPGFSGAHFLPQTPARVAEFHAAHPQILVGVDGGITPETATQVAHAGAGMVVSTSYIQKSSDVAEAVRALQVSG